MEDSRSSWLLQGGTRRAVAIPAFALPPGRRSHPHPGKVRQTVRESQQVQEIVVTFQHDAV